MLRILISPTRSGSTAFLRCFENNADVAKVFHQPVKSGYRQDGEFDYGFFSLDTGDERSIFVAKETVGGFARPETDFNPVCHMPAEVPIANRFPSVAAIAKVRPVFLFRDPLQTWNSIHKLNEYSIGRSSFFSPFEYFVTSYRSVFDFMLLAKRATPYAYCLTLERLAAHPDAMFRQICSKWHMKFYNEMIEWSRPYGIKTHYSEETKHRMAHDPRFKRSKDCLERSPRFEYFPSDVHGISVEQCQRINKEIRPLYDHAVVLSAQDFPLSRLSSLPQKPKVTQSRESSRGQTVM